jgi:hypothetical protein
MTGQPIIPDTRQPSERITAVTGRTRLSKRLGWKTVSSRSAAILASVVIAVIILGCMSISIGRHIEEHVSSDDSLLVQEGEVRLRPGCTQDVCYPVPYARAPNLEVTDTFDHCEVIVQKEDFFRVVNHDVHFSRTACWKARGLKACVSPLPPVTPPVTSPPTAAALPPEPIPVP